MTEKTETSVLAGLGVPVILFAGFVIAGIVGTVLWDTEETREEQRVCADELSRELLGLAHAAEAAGHGAVVRQATQEYSRVTRIHLDRYRNICDYYSPAASIRLRKKP